MINLKTLSLYGNSISSFYTDVFKDLSALEYLDIGLNQISVLDDVNLLSSLTNLKTFKADANPLTSIINIFTGLINLISIDLSHSPINTVSVLATAPFAGKTLFKCNYLFIENFFKYIFICFFLSFYK